MVEHASLSAKRPIARIIQLLVRKVALMAPMVRPIAMAIVARSDFNIMEFTLWSIGGSFRFCTSPIALKERGIDMAEVMSRAVSGQDISEHYDALAETFGVTRQVVENYVAKAQGSAPAEAPGLTEADAAQLKAMVGGEDSFNKLSQWAASNLEKGELAKYNAVVDSGNKDAIEWALKALQARVAAPDSVVEPKLYGGGEKANETRFESKQQVLDAMSKRNSKGQKLYEVDESYRAKVQQLLSASDVF